MKEIILRSKKYGNKIVLVDDEDFDRVNSLKWYYHRTEYNTGKVLEYARRTSVWDSFTNKRSILLHRFILGVLDDDCFVDHKDGNGLNNQKDNIRKCTRAENNWNKSVSIKKKSKYIGVYYFKKSEKHVKTWKVYFRMNGKKLSFKGYENEIDAAMAYNEAVLKFRGPFSKLNEIPISPPQDQPPLKE